MLVDYLKGNIRFEEKVENWETAIEKSAQPLLDSGVIRPEYIQGMIDNVKKNGSYIVILPEIAIPHARKEAGAIKTGLTFLQLKEAVLFPEEKPVKLLMALSANTDDGHLEMLGELGMILMDEEIVETLKNAKNEEEVLRLIAAVEV